jgi:nucleotidyltransferase/DNA polymerase involved in DNA repair
MIACVRVRQFAATVERLANPELEGLPLILIAYQGQRGKVVAASKAAEIAGVVPGLSKSRAKALCPSARFLVGDQKRYDQALDHLLAVLWEFTSQVEIDEAAYPHEVIAYLDLGTLNDRDLRQLGEQMISTIAATAQAEVTVGIASGKFPAYVTAHVSAGGQVVIIPKGAEAHAVAPYPVAFLPMSKATARKMHLLCIHQIGDLAKLSSPGALVAQFGKPGRLLYWLAQGIDGRPVVRRRMPRAEHKGISFDPPVSNRDRLDAAVHRIADALADRLEARVAAAHHLTVQLYSDRGEAFDTVEHQHVFTPVVTARGIAEALQPLIERSLPRLQQSGVVGIEVRLMQFVSGAPKQMELLTHRPARQLLIDLMPALEAHYGSARFYEAEPGDRGSLLVERRFHLRRIGNHS